MIPAKNERFLDLARRALTGKATASEQQEIADMLGNEPSLEAEYQRLGKDLSIVKEILPLLKAAEAPGRTVPPMARSRLQAKVRESLARKQETAEERRGLFDVILSWAEGGRTEEVRQRRLALIAEIPERLLRRPEPEMLFEATPRLAETVEMACFSPALSPKPPAPEEADIRLQALIDQLRQLQNQIRKLKEESANEVRGLLEQARQRQEQSLAQLSGLERQSSEIEARLLSLLETLGR
jgi:hypothetical protein